VHFELGDVFLDIEEGGSAEAKRQYEKAHELANQLVAAEPQNAQGQRDLSVSHDKLGDVQMRLGGSKAALAAYQQGLLIRERLARADPQNAQAQRDLLVSYYKLGNVEQQVGEFAKAVEWYTRAVDIPKRFPRPEFFKREVGIVQSRIRFCRAAATALADPAGALKQPEALRLPVLVAVAGALARHKQADKALAAADLLAANAKAAGHLYDAACVHALCVPLADGAAAKEKRAARAVELLRQAVGKGYNEAGHMKRDTDLDALRGRDDFKKLLDEMQAAASAKKSKAP
jgi:tetratricopeptide (TPR) repeat protein